MQKKYATAEPCAECGHRQYDHITESGGCWKCLCPEYREDVTETGTDPAPTPYS